MFNKNFLIFLISFLLFSCSLIQTVENINSLKFKISNVDNFYLSGIELKSKKSLKDFNSIEILKLTSTFAKGNLPIKFTLNVEAINPNNGINDFTSSDIKISSFPYKFFLNDKEILSGNIEQPISIPNKGESTLIPLKIEFDLIKLLENKSFEEIISFVLTLSRENNSTQNIKLKAQPSILTKLGEFKYPKEILIVDKDFN